MSREDAFREGGLLGPQAGSKDSPRTTVTRATKLRSTWRLASPRSVRPARVWFAVLLGAICLEGLGRKFVPVLPSVFWYFAKDVVLLTGLALFGVSRASVTTVRSLYRGFGVFLMAAAIWTLLQAANPEQKSVALAVIGLRAYWLWWVAPLIVASALRDRKDLVFALRAMAVFAIGIALLGVVQFEFPGDAPVNRYAWDSSYMAVATVAQTGRVRISSTFSYLTGFTDFAIVTLPVLLALGLGEGRGWTRALCFVGAALLGIAVPMSGSRAPIVVSLGTMGIVAWQAGILRTRRGRAIAVGALLLGAVSYLGSREAVEGVESRFAGADTGERFTEMLQILPPIALADNDYPLLGIGTGMQQNARVPLGVRTDWEAEGETGRYLVELGVLGYLFVWTVRLGLAVALVRAARLARLAGRLPLSGLAFAFACLTFLGSLTFDHVWQALYFVGVGFILSGVLSSLQDDVARRAAASR